MDVNVNGNTFFSGIPYNVFSDNKGCVDYEIVCTASGGYEFYLPYSISPTVENPLKVYIDGIETVIDNITLMGSSQTYVKLKRGVPYGSVVRFFYAGEPRYRVTACISSVKVYSDTTKSSVLATMNMGDSADYINGPENENWYKVNFGGTEGYVSYLDTRKIPTGVDSTSVAYPSATIIVDSEFTYMYDPYNGIAAEVVKYNGRQLRRVDSASEITQYGLEYYVSGGVIYTNYSLNNEILDVVVLETNGMIQKSVYKRLTVKSDSIVYTNRFFPDVMTSRAELFICMNHLRINLFARFTDSYKDVDVEYTSRFSDVQEILDASGGNYPWWWDHVYQLERLMFSDGEYLLQGTGGNLLVEKPITRAEMITIVDRFREWIVDVFK